MFQLNLEIRITFNMPRIFFASLILAAVAAANANSQEDSGSEVTQTEKELGDWSLDGLLTTAEHQDRQVREVTPLEEENNEAVEILSSEELVESSPQEISESEEETLTVTILEINIEDLLSSGRRHVDAWNGLNFCPAKEIECHPYYYWDSYSC
jgi:hypothetical protein